jgi:uncharacterized membrane protein YccC
MAADAQPTEVITPEAVAAAKGDGIRLSQHPKARRHIGMAKGWGGLIAFALVLKISRGSAGLPWPDAIERACVAGVVGYVVAWAIAQTVWRHIALAELEQLRTKLIRMAEEQQEARERQIAEAEAAAAATKAAAGNPLAPQG